MLDKTIDSALLSLRRNLVRDGGEGLEHVEALLTIRNVPTPRVMPLRSQDVARHGLMRLLILDALKDGSKTLREITAHVASHRPEITQKAAYQRTGQALAKMKARGMVERDGRIWLMLPAANSPSTGGSRETP